MNPMLRNALIISIIVHLLIISPLYGFVIFREAADVNKPIVVDYVVFKDPKEIDIRNPALAPQKLRESKKAEVRQDVRLKSGTYNADSAKSPHKTAPASSSLAQKTEAKIRATKDYVSYYQLIRQKIRSCLKNHYGTQYMEGDVRLVFVLKSDGSLISARVDEDSSSANEALFDIAVKSVREASPFAPFPKALSLPKMTFELAVTFRK
jgi:TonB family protein